MISNKILLALIIVTIPFLFLFAQADADSSKQTDNLDVLKERVDNLKETVEENKADLQREMDQRDDKVNDKFETYITAISLVGFIFLIIGSLATFIGYRRIKKFLLNLLKEKTDELMKPFKVEIELAKEEIIQIKNDCKAELEKIVELRKQAESKRELKEIGLEPSKYDSSEPLTNEQELTLDDFVVSLGKAKSENEYTFDDWFLKGVKEYNDANYQEAIITLSRALDLNPNEVNTIANRGIAYANNRDYKLSIKDFSKAIDIDPSIDDFYYNRGLSHNNLELYKEAIKDFNKAIEIDSSKADQFYARGNVYVILKQYELAKEDFYKATEINPEYNEAYQNLSEALIINSESLEALTHVNHALSISKTTNERANSLFLKCIAEKLQGEDTTSTEKEFVEILKKEFTIDWSFRELEDWLEKAELPEDTKEFIRDKIDKLKAKKKKE